MNSDEDEEIVKRMDSGEAQAIVLARELEAKILRIDELDVCLL